MLSTLALVLAISTVAADKWEIKAPYRPQSAVVWKLTGVGHLPDGDTEAEFLLVVEGPEQDDAKTKVFWREFVSDGNPVGEMGPWEVDIDAQGAVVPKEKEMARMLIPMFLGYPDKPLGPGDTWEQKIGPESESFKLSGKAEALEQLGDAEVLRLATDLVGSGERPTSAQGTWWVDRQGRVLKFKLRLRDWYVPMADGTQTFDAELEGELRK